MRTLTKDEILHAYQVTGLTMAPPHASVTYVHDLGWACPIAAVGIKETGIRTPSLSRYKILLGLDQAYVDGLLLGFESDSELDPFATDSRRRGYQLGAELRIVRQELLG